MSRPTARLGAKRQRIKCFALVPNDPSRRENAGRKRFTYGCSSLKAAGALASDRRAVGRLMPDAADQLPIMPTVLCQTGFGHQTTFTILGTRLDRAETGARMRSESEAQCLASRATRCCASHAVARHLMRRSLAKCSCHRLVNLQRKARFNIGHRVST
jgi:hypothetical protein